MWPCIPFCDSMGNLVGTPHGVFACTQSRFLGKVFAGAILALLGSGVWAWAFLRDGVSFVFRDCYFPCVY